MTLYSLQMFTYVDLIVVANYRGRDVIGYSIHITAVLIVIATNNDCIDTQFDMKYVCDFTLIHYHCV